MGGGSAVVRMRWWWEWGGAFVNREAGEGVGPKNRNRAPVARFWAPFGLQEVEGSAVGVTATPPIVI